MEHQKKKSLKREVRNILLNTHSAYFIYGNKMSDMVNDQSDSDRGTYMGYSFGIGARALLYASCGQDITYHVIWFTSCRSL